MYTQRPVPPLVSKIKHASNTQRVLRNEDVTECFTFFMDTKLLILKRQPAEDSY